MPGVIMSDPNHIASPPAGANAGPTKPASDQRRIITDRLPVPPRRSRTSTAPASSSASRRVRWIVGGIIALVIIGGGVLLYVQDAAARRETERAAQRRASQEWSERAERNAKLDQALQQAKADVESAEKWLAKLRAIASSETQQFTFLRRFGAPKRDGNITYGVPMYQAVRNGTHQCVLRVSEVDVTTDRMGLKSYFGKAEAIGEVAYTTESDAVKYMDTYRAVTASDADIAAAQAKVERARAALVTATEARAAEPPNVPNR